MWPPSPPWQTAQPSLSPKVSMLNVCKASCQDMWIYPELPSMLCFKLSDWDICDSFSLSRCFPAKNQMHPTPSWTQGWDWWWRTFSDISQALPCFSLPFSQASLDRVSDFRPLNVTQGDLSLQALFNLKPMFVEVGRCKNMICQTPILWFCWVLPKNINLCVFM